MLQAQNRRPAPIATLPSPISKVETPALGGTAKPTMIVSPIAPEPAPPPVAAVPTKPAMSAAEAAKAEAGTDATVVGDTGSKNVRSGPGTKYDSPHMAYPGDRIKLMATSRDEAGYTWHKVYFPKSGAEGWIAAQLVRLDRGSIAPSEGVSESPRSADPAPAQPSEPAAPAAATNGTIIGEAGSKNVRSGPGTSYDSPHMAYPGDRVQIIDTSRDKGGFTWYKVYFPQSGASGWIAAQLVKAD
jgi:serine/threonine protein kinase, bacterial